MFLELLGYLIGQFSVFFGYLSAFPASGSTGMFRVAALEFKAIYSFVLVFPVFFSSDGSTAIFSLLGCFPESVHILAHLKSFLLDRSL